MMLLATAGTFIITLGMVSVSVLLIGLILLQKNRGSGLSGALGGVGGHSAFGTKTGDFLTWVTVGLVAVFLLLAIVGNYVFEPTTKPNSAGTAVAGQPALPTPSPMPTPTQQQVQPTANLPAMPIKVESSPGGIVPIITPMSSPPRGAESLKNPPTPTTQPSR